MSDKLATVDENVSLVMGDDFTPTQDRPKELGNSVAGTEDITLDEIRLPRLAIAQGLSPELESGDPKYIPSLKKNDFFNTLNGDVYGQGPLLFVPVRRDTRRIQFKPRSEGGGVIDPNVPATDPRMAWGPKDPTTGKGTPPVATEFKEFVVLLLRPGKVPEPIVISIKTTNKANKAAATNLLSYIKIRNAPIYAGIYTVAVASEKNEKGTFGVYVMKNAGFLDHTKPAQLAVYNYAEQFHESLKDKVIDVDRAEDDSFEASELEPAAGTTEM